MKEKLYTIPINDAFAMDSECPICAMKTILENNAVEFTMGPSYMEDDIRMETDRMGFCKAHMKMVFDQNNKLGLALVLKTHIDLSLIHISSSLMHLILKKSATKSCAAIYTAICRLCVR